MPRRSLMFRTGLALPATAAAVVLALAPSAASTSSSGNGSVLAASPKSDGKAAPKSEAKPAPGSGPKDGAKPGAKTDGKADAKTDGKADARHAVSFSKDIAPLLVAKCISCHGPKKASGAWRADTYARLLKEGNSGTGVVPGKPADSWMYLLINSGTASERMPPKSPPLPDADIAKVKLWIEQGAPFDGTDKNAPVQTLLPAKAGAFVPPATYRRAVPVYGLAFDPTGATVAVGGAGEVTLWSARDGSMVRRLAGAGRRVQAVAWSRDGSLIAAASGTPGESGELTLLDPAGKSDARTVVTGAEDLLLTTEFSPDGTLLAAGSADRTVRVIRVADGTEVFRTRQFADWVTRVAFSRDGALLLAVSRDGMGKVFDPATGKLRAAYGGHGKGIRAAAFDPDGDTAATAGDDGRVHLWKPLEYAAFDGTAALMESRFAKEPPVRHIKDVPVPAGDVRIAGGRVLLAGPDGRVRTWALKGAVAGPVLTGAADAVTVIATSSDGSRIAAGTFDGEVLIWDAAALPAVEASAPGSKSDGNGKPAKPDKAAKKALLAPAPKPAPVTAVPAGATTDGVAPVLRFVASPGVSAAASTK